MRVVRILVAPNIPWIPIFQHQGFGAWCRAMPGTWDILMSAKNIFKHMWIYIYICLYIWYYNDIYIYITPILTNFRVPTCSNYPQVTRLSPSTPAPMTPCTSNPEHCEGSCAGHTRRKFSGFTARILLFSPVPEAAAFHPRNLGFHMFSHPYFDWDFWDVQCLGCMVCRFWIHWFFTQVFLHIYYAATQECLLLCSISFPGKFPC